jgi:hypothetical protein
MVAHNSIEAMGRDTFLQLLQRAARAHQKAQYAIDMMAMDACLGPVPIDEVSLLFRTKAELDAFAKAAD